MTTKPISLRELHTILQQKYAEKSEQVTINTITEYKITFKKSVVKNLPVIPKIDIQKILSKINYLSNKPLVATLR